MIVILANRPSYGAANLRKALAERGIEVRRKGDDYQRGDFVVNWGSYGYDLGPRRGLLRVLNPNIIGDKYRELNMLRENEIPVPPYRVSPHEGYRARRSTHEEANDLLANLARGDYYVRIVPTEDEMRFHIWENALGIRVSIKADVKVPMRPDADPVFRSTEGGWTLTNQPDRVPVRRRDAMREVAKQAVAAVGYNFGAVDIAWNTETNQPVVFEVNSAPGVVGNDLPIYADQVEELYRAARG